VVLDESKGKKIRETMKMAKHHKRRIGNGEARRVVDNGRSMRAVKGNLGCSL
jgi:hypothetical protein